ncbi:MAG: hypothetical protein IPL52_08170 [Flavobacteriales bacterium]|nr:hypothetical protein [Flavobacteriales bacterium]
MSSDPQQVRFLDAHGGTVLTYSGLKAWDSNGQMLPTYFALTGSVVTLVVDERTACYPITIDPIAQQAYLKASNSNAGDSFGVSVAIWGETA